MMPMVQELVQVLVQEQELEQELELELELELAPEPAPRLARLRQHQHLPSLVAAVDRPRQTAAKQARLRLPHPWHSA